MQQVSTPHSGALRKLANRRRRFSIRIHSSGWIGWIELWIGSQSVLLIRKNSILDAVKFYLLLVDNECLLYRSLLTAHKQTVAVFRDALSAATWAGGINISGAMSSVGFSNCVDGAMVTLNPGDFLCVGASCWKCLRNLALQRSVYALPFSHRVLPPKGDGVFS